MTRRREILLDCALLFIAASIFLAPYYTHKYTDQWPSIESTFISDARFLAAHWPHPQWQPLWYEGTRFDYIYPPALRYGTALLSKIFGWWTVKAYHFYTIFFYCMGISGVYLLVRAGRRPRAAAYLCALAALLMSPSLLLFKNMRVDAGPWHVPVRFGALIRYGEGPHITALCLLPIALAFAWRALEAKRPRSVVLAAVFCAAVVSNNFYGATSLAIFFPLLVWSFFVTRGARAVVFPALAIPLAAYGLTAFWLTPSYLRITLHNMAYVSEKGSAWSDIVAAVVLAVFGVISYRAARARKEGTWGLFIVGALLFFSLNVIGNHFLNFRVIGEPGRLIPELDLVMILAAGLLGEWMWRRPGPWLKLAVAVVVMLAFATTLRYVKHGRHVIEPWPNYQSRVEYRVTDWLWKNMPNARALPSGTVRFWFDAWHDLTEMGGGSEQGLLNSIVPNANAEIENGTNPEAARLWLKAMGVDAMYLSSPQSQEPYKDTHNAGRFATLPLLFDDGMGNTIYGTERRYPARARVVDTAKLASVPTLRSNDDLDCLRPYVDTIEKGPDSPVTIDSPSTDEMRLHAQIAPGQSLLVQETFDPAWQAWADGKRLPVHTDVMKFMVVDAPPGDRTVRLEFVMPLENRVGWGLTFLTVLALAGLAMRGRKPWGGGPR
ncbi:MAG TPA: hypothetical protein VHW09_12295 [Bryobacteraceae bacterium]|nr:hypothetical protein [Bryobacteraceae bacterium]